MNRAVRRRRAREDARLRAARRRLEAECRPAAVLAQADDVERRRAEAAEAAAAVQIRGIVRPVGMHSPRFNFPAKKGADDGK